MRLDQNCADPLIRTLLFYRKRQPKFGFANVSEFKEESAKRNRNAAPSGFERLPHLIARCKRSSSRTAIESCGVRQPLLDAARPSQLFRIDDADFDDDLSQDIGH